MFRAARFAARALYLLTPFRMYQFLSDIASSGHAQA